MSAYSVAGFVSDFYDLNQEGPTRRDIADYLGATQTKNLAGVRQAISMGLIRYDGSQESRLIPIKQAATSNDGEGGAE